MRSLYVELRVNYVELLQEQQQPPEIGVIKEWKLMEINSMRTVLCPKHTMIYKYVGRYEGKDVDQELAVKTACELNSNGFFDFTMQINEYMSVEEFQENHPQNNRIQEEKLTQDMMTDYLMLMFKSMGLDDNEIKRKYEIED